MATTDDRSRTVHREFVGSEPGGKVTRNLNVNPFVDASQQLHRYLVQTHWTGDVLRGPDPGIRFNARFGRFVKGYLSFIPWKDDLVYLQAQGYWILDNWLLQDLFDGVQSGEIAETCSRQVLRLQRPEGYWEYPNPEWKGRVATVEGCFATLGLLESFDRLQDECFIDGAIKWYRYVCKSIGFRRQTSPDMLAVNYFTHFSGDGGGVPNNSTMLLWVLARLAQLTDDDAYLELCAPMIRWLAHVQLESGELPYQLGDGQRPDRIHFLCYQYNAFELVDLVHYYEITGDESVTPILVRLAQYLSHGVTSEGCGRYSCIQDQPHVTYYTSAIAHALSLGSRLGLVDCNDAIECAYRRVLSEQLPNGSMKSYSQNNYRVLSDRRSYPRYLAMTLHHLLREVELARESDHE